MSKGYAVISTEFCDVSEFSGEPWAKSSCQIGTRDENENNSLTKSNQDPSSLSQKQEQQVPSDSDSSKSNKAQSEGTKQKESYQLIIYLDNASPQNVIGDNFKILVYNSNNEPILSAKPNIDFNDDHQKISPSNGYPIIYQSGQYPKDIRVCAQQEYQLNGTTYLHNDCYPIVQNVQKTYWYTIFDYGEIDGYVADSNLTAKSNEMTPATATITPENKAESNNQTAGNITGADSGNITGTEQMTLTAQMKPIIKNLFTITKFGFVASDNSELCPQNNCKYGVEGGRFSTFGGGGYLFYGKLKVTTQDGDVKKSKLYDFSEVLDKTGEEERNGETLESLKGTFAVGPHITYEITNATLKVGDKNPVLTIQAERS